MLTSLFSLFYVTREFHRFLHRGRAQLGRLTKKATELPGEASSLIICFCPITGTEFDHFWNWFGKNKFPGALQLLKQTFTQKYCIVPASSPWVSKDAVVAAKLYFQASYGICSTKKSLKPSCLLEAHVQEFYFFTLEESD